MFEIDDDNSNSNDTVQQIDEKEKEIMTAIKKAFKGKRTYRKNVLLPTHQWNEVALIIYLLMEQLETLI